MKHPLFQVGEECRIDVSQTCPQLSHLTAIVIGGLKRRAIYNSMGEPAGYELAYLIELEGLPENGGMPMEVCAPERMLQKRWQRSDWRALKHIWQPKREKR